MIPTKEQFEEYKRMETDGISNIFDGECFCANSKSGLTPDICKLIRKHYDYYSKVFAEG